MEFLIADSFVDSLSKLRNEEQKAVKTTVFDLQLNPSNPGLSYHKLDRAQDPNFASVRVNQDIRVIVHQSRGSLLVCYVDHHENAYQWARRRKLESHPKTGAAQMVEVRETVQEIIVPTYITEERLKPPLFKNRSDDELLGYGVPPEWLEDVKEVTEDTLLELADHLPAEASEALLELATGGTPTITIATETITDPFEHPDAKRRFRMVSDVEELQMALEYPWEKWAVFLHPDQRSIATADYNGPARVSGSAGTGKTVVALHRAVHLAKNNPGSRVLLATFSETLANSLRNKLRTLIFNQPHLGEQIEVYAMNKIGEHLYKSNRGKNKVADSEFIYQLLKQASSQVNGHSFRQQFLMTEWEQVVDAWQLNSWEAYRDVSRLGRRTRLSESQRNMLWSIFSWVQNELDQAGLITYAGIFGYLTKVYSGGQRSPFEYIVVDEAQDINIPQLKFLAALGANRPNSLFFAGDLGQRIFQQPFSWLSLGIDIRGRTKTLRINYRTSHQIRSQADKLLGPEITDVDGIVEKRNETISVFSGPSPEIVTYENEEDEIAAVSTWLTHRSEEGVVSEEIGVFVRSENQIQRAKTALELAGLNYRILDQKVETQSDYASLCTMHLAKGLEFRTVVVMACDDEVLPLQERIETVTDNSDLEEVYNTERHLLYVACTRARDFLLITGVNPASEFLDDMLKENL
jgi:mRNA-degrading endonuclease RelE of RelBE toxin-antitoxin system